MKTISLPLLVYHNHRNINQQNKNVFSMHHISCKGHFFYSLYEFLEILLKNCASCWVGWLIFTIDWLTFLRGDKGDSIRASYVHCLDQSQKRTIVGEITRKFSMNENTVTFGGSYEVDPLTTIKGKLNNNGKLGALLQHELVPKSLLTISGEIDTRALDRTPKLGLSIALVP